MNSDKTNSTANTVNSPENCQLSLDGRALADKRTLTYNRTLAYKKWGNTGLPIIALHGWQDNAASFDFLAPQLLAHCQLAAVDLAGHGLSYHRSGDAAYNIWQDLDDIIQLADALNWDKFVIMGHSRGAFISTLLAASFPERVCAWIGLDGLLPAPVRADNAPQQLAAAIAHKRKYQHRSPRCYANYERVLAQRLKTGLPLSADMVAALAVRGVKHTDEGYFWNSDHRLRGASELKLTEDHCKAFIAAVNCPALLLWAENHKFRFNTELLALNSLFQVKELAGSHHFHMEPEAVVVIGAAINDFLAARLLTNQ